MGGGQGVLHQPVKLLLHCGEPADAVAVVVSFHTVINALLVGIALLLYKKVVRKGEFHKFPRPFLILTF